MNNNIYLLWISIPTLGIEKYIDSIWENKDDTIEHISECLKHGIFNENTNIEIETKQLNKHI